MKQILAMVILATLVIIDVASAAEHPAWKHGKRLDVKIFTQLYPGGPQYYCGNGKYCEDMEAVKAFIAEAAPDKISFES